jgi:carbon-monoxide dehydrogenase large subunit
MAKFGIGQPVRRVEDQRLVTGRGRYTDDIDLEGQVYGYVVRSPHAHARIRAIDTSRALAAPGVLAVLTAADTGDAGVPCFVPMKNRDGSDAPMPAHPILAKDKVRYVGDKVAFVVASSRARARDAAELVAVDYEPLEAVVDTAAALEPGRPQVHAECPRNLAFDWLHGDEAAVEKAFAGAARVVRLELVNNRLVCNPMEPRAAVAEWDAAAGRLTVHTCTQGGWAFRDTLAANLGLPKEKVRVLTPDVGGGFGMKAMFYGEYTLCAVAARKLGRPVKWTSERGEAFLSDSQGRDHVTVAELGFDAEHRIVGMRCNVVANMGAYYYFYAPFIPTFAALKVLPGVYDVKCLSYGVKAVFTNTVPVDAYRGAGRPESIYCIERLMDLAAAELGVDRLELRRRNFIRPEQMPFATAVGETYDSGEFARVMAEATRRADWQGAAARKAEAAARGRRRGIGLCFYIESTMGNPVEHATVRFAADGAVEVLVGTQSNGQGHETAYAQVLAERLGVELARVRIVQGDTARLEVGRGTGGSRSMVWGGGALVDAATAIIDRGRELARADLGEDVDFADGLFRARGSNRTLDWTDLAARHPKALDTRARYAPEKPGPTFPNGCHVAEVEIDPDTGVVSIARYSIVDDFGTLVNPLLVEGQVHGGIAQGLGQALLENVVYDSAAQLLTGSFMDYGVPRADDMPRVIDFDTRPVPNPNNPLGAKGCGEAGTIGAMPSIMNAIIDALDGTQIEMPATPEKIWRACEALKARAAA